MGVFTLFALFTLPTWRMLHAGGQRLTFCTDHIHHYYHHCFSSNRAEHHIPMRHKPHKMGEWTAISLQLWEGEEGLAGEKVVGRANDITCIKTKKDSCLNEAVAK